MVFPSSYLSRRTFDVNANWTYISTFSSLRVPTFLNKDNRGQKKNNRKKVVIHAKNVYRAPDLQNILPASACCVGVSFYVSLSAMEFQPYSLFSCSSSPQLHTILWDQMPEEISGILTLLMSSSWDFWLSPCPPTHTCIQWRSLLPPGEALQTSPLWSTGS